MAVLIPGSLVVLGGAIVWESIGLGLWVALGPGPGFFPFILGVLLAALSAAWGMRDLADGHGDRLRNGAAEKGSGPTQSSGEAVQLPAKRVIMILGSLVVLAAGLNTIGFQLSVLVFLVFHLRVAGRQGWLLTTVVSVIGSFGIFVFFSNFLSVTLPAASIPFLRTLGL